MSWKVSASSPYVAYHELGKTANPKTPMLPGDSAVDLDRLLTDTIVKAFDISPLELGVVEKPKKHYVYAAGYGYIEAKDDASLANEDRKYAIEMATNRTITPRELSNLLKEPKSPFFAAMREKTANDVHALLDTGLMTPNEARLHLGLPEPEKPKQPGMLTMADIDRLLESMWNNAREPDSMFVSSSDYERLQQGTLNPFEGLRSLISDSFNTKENLDMSISNNSVQDLVNQARDLAKDGKTNLDSVKSAIDKGKAEYKERIEKALSGAAELEILKGPQGKQFVIKHFYSNKEYTAYGIAYPGYDASEKAEEDLDALTVFIQDDNDPLVSTEYQTMRRLRKELDVYGVPYVIKFYE